jgi:thiol-disulfide isomerase/thioredoxin
MTRSPLKRGLFAPHQIFLLFLFAYSTSAFTTSGLPSIEQRRPSNMLSSKNYGTRCKRPMVLGTAMNWEAFGGFFLPPPADRRRREAESGVPIVVIDISKDDDLESLLSQAQMVGKMVCIDWYASWCRKCIYFEPRFKRIARNHQDSVIFARVDALELEWCVPACLQSTCTLANF